MQPNINFSLIVTNYNKGLYIARAIRSCLMQLVVRQIIEVIVIDDGSTDNSMIVLKEFGDEIQVFQNKKNIGVANASNIGLKNARGKYWMRVDADDFLNMNACAFMGSILDNNNEFGFVFSDHFRVDSNGKKIDRVSLSDEEILFEHGAGVLFRTQLLKDLGGYDESLRNCEDRDLLYRLKKIGIKGYHLPIPLYRYYIHGNNISQSKDRDNFKKIVEQKHAV